MGSSPRQEDQGRRQELRLFPEREARRELQRSPGDCSGSCRNLGDCPKLELSAPKGRRGAAADAAKPDMPGREGPSEAPRRFGSGGFLGRPAGSGGAAPASARCSRLERFCRPVPWCLAVAHDSGRDSSTSRRHSVDPAGVDQRLHGMGVPPFRQDQRRDERRDRHRSPRASASPGGGRAAARRFVRPAPLRPPHLHLGDDLARHQVPARRGGARGVRGLAVRPRLAAPARLVLGARRPAALRRPRPRPLRRAGCSSSASTTCWSTGASST